MQEECQLFWRDAELNATCWLQAIFTKTASEAFSDLTVFFSDTFSLLQALKTRIQLTCNNLRLNKPYRQHFQHFTDFALEIAKPLGTQDKRVGRER
jgi:hypothetical protein